MKGEVGVDALKVVGKSAAGVAPSLLAYDVDRDFLITEDFAPRRTLHSVLSNGLATRGGIAGLHTFAATMARLHAATAAVPTGGPWDDSARILIRLESASSLLDRLHDLVPVTRGTRADVAAALAEIDQPEAFAAFSNGDSGANNCLVDADGGDGRLIDFEQACRRHVLLDAAALHVPGSMWMTVADPVPLGVERTYREVAGTALPAVLDDELYGFGLAAACAVTALTRLERFDKLDGRDPGHNSRPHLVTTLDRTVDTMTRWGELAGLASWLGEVARALRNRWPDADLAFPDDYTLREPFHPDH
ncbi:MAG: hypothetical protein ACR2H3_12420 [Acidimicrobiales bacterium]